MQQRLSHALQTSPVVASGDQLLLPAETLLAIVEDWAPEALRIDPRNLHRPEHPGGDGFFTGDPRQVSDEQAERIARQQLERSGYLARDGRSTP